MIERAPRPDSGFLMIRNAVVRDARLSYRASGVLADILSRPDNWKTTAESLAKARPDGEGEKAIRAALRELEAAGYLRRRRYKDEKGRFRWKQTVYDVPVSDDTAHSIDVSPGQSISPQPPDGNRPAETGVPKKTREEDLQEDVTDPICSTSGRFAPSGGDTDDHLDSIDGEAVTTGTFTDWRTQDRALFRELVGDALISHGGQWREGKFTADAFYDAYRKREKRIRWPGRFLDSIYTAGSDPALDDWLTDQGLERVA